MLPPIFNRWCLSILQTCLLLLSLPCWQMWPCSCSVRSSAHRRKTCGGFWETPGTSPGRAAVLTHLCNSVNAGCYLPIFNRLYVSAPIPALPHPDWEHSESVLILVRVTAAFMFYGKMVNRSVWFETIANFSSSNCFIAMRGQGSALGNTN